MPLSPPEQPEFEQETWDPTPEPKWYQRWSRGWRLVGVLLTLVVVYGVVRRGKDYQKLMDWRGRNLAREALEKEDVNGGKETILLLEKAGIMAPNDPEVLRALASFNEAHENVMALYALRKLVGLRQATDQEREHLCRLAFDWGHPELADGGLLAEWAKADPATLPPLQLELSARWMILRGQFSVGETRLRNALEKSKGEEVAKGIELVLCRLLLASPAAREMKETTISEITARLEHVIQTTTPGSLLRGDAAKLLAGLLEPAALEKLREPDRVSLVKKTLQDQAEAVAKKPEALLEMRLTMASLELALKPESRDETARALLEFAASQDDKLKLKIGQWLNERQFHSMVLELCDAQKARPENREWFTQRLDALFALKEYDKLTEQLAAGNQPLPPVVRSLFMYRIDVVRGKDEATLDADRQKFAELVRQADARDLLFVAGNLEHIGEVARAADLYSRLQNHPQAGLPARLGLVRCLDPQLERTADLIQALDSVIRLWPNFDVARGDLAYLRLIEKTDTREDREAAHGLARDQPWMLAYRVSSALAFLREGKAAEALALLQDNDVTWSQVRPGWQAVRAAVVAANGHTEEARSMVRDLSQKTLRPGEQKLVESLAIPTP